MNKSTLDAGIPVLTEIIEPPPEAEVLAAESPASLAEAHAAPPAPTSPELDEAHWQRLQYDITERVLYQVLERIDTMLEQRVRDSLADVLQVSVDRLTREIQGGLHQGIKEVVRRAVEQELASMRPSKK